MPVAHLPSIPSGADVYIDANILVYAMLNKSPECLAFITRCGTDINGYSDVKVLHDTMHKLMLAEAGKTASALKSDPSRIRTLTVWQRLGGLVRNLPVEWIDVRVAEVDRVPAQATYQGLLCGDTLIAVLMADYGITAIATNDRDFGALGLQAYAPRDI